VKLDANNYIYHIPVNYILSHIQNHSY